MNSALEKLSGPGQSLRSEPPDTKEFTGLKRSGHARLTDAAKTDNSLESRFDLAYNAAHSLCHIGAISRHAFALANLLR